MQQMQFYFKNWAHTSQSNRHCMKSFSLTFSSGSWKDSENQGPYWLNVSNNFSISQLIMKLPATEMYSAKGKQQQNKQTYKIKNALIFATKVCIKGNKFLTGLLPYGLDCSYLNAVDCMSVGRQHILLQHHVLKAIISEKQNLTTCSVVFPEQVNSGSCTELWNI